eukprot:TRINITY_DN446_c0_g1_i5.p1 TRINITY_DN446_c0_g1~~TRINITY_DN446_c0_g1_i5.p1  ORF type:complete len:686 (-),score=44.20 TRINITY_DN446_c0_g1_i5:158-2215(-)
MDGYFIKQYRNRTNLESSEIYRQKTRLLMNVIPQYGFSLDTLNRSALLKLPLPIEELIVYIVFSRASIFYINSTGFLMENLTFFGCSDCVRLLTSNAVLNNLTFYNCEDSIIVQSDSVVSNCYFETIGLRKFRNEYMTDPSTIHDDLFSDLFYNFSGPVTNTIVCIGSNSTPCNNVVIQNCTFNNSQGIYLEKSENVTIQNNFFFEVYTTCVTFLQSDQVHITNNMMINITSGFQSGSSNGRIFIDHNVLYTTKYFRPFFFYYLYVDNYLNANEISKNDELVVMEYNTFWSCSTNYCNVLSSEPTLVNEFRFHHNIVQLSSEAESTSNPVNMSQYNNLIFGTLPDENVNDTYCRNSSRCVNYESEGVLFRNNLTLNFGIDYCYIKMLEFEPFNSSYWRYSDGVDFWVGKGLGSSRYWFGENIDQYVGAFPGNMNPGIDWPRYAPKRAFSTTYREICNCTSVIRAFNLFPYLDKKPCEVSNMTLCSSCSTGTLQNSSFVVNQTQTTLSELSVVTSTLTYKGSVVLENSSKLTLENSNLIVEGSLSLSSLSYIVISGNTSVVVSGTVNFSGVLVLNYSHLSKSEFESVASMPIEIIKYSKSNNRFASFTVIPPTVATTTGAIGQLDPTYELQYLDSSLFLIVTSPVPSLTPSPTSNPTPSVQSLATQFNPYLALVFSLLFVLLICKY